MKLTLATTVLICLMLVALGILGYLGRPAEMVISTGTFSVAILFLNLDKFHKFKGPGIEAEMRKVTDEAYATIENLKSLERELQNLALVLAEPVIQVTNMSGVHMQYMVLEYKVRLIDRVVESLSTLGISQSDIDPLLENFHSRIRQKHSHRLYNAIKNASKSKETAMPGWDEEMSEWEPERFEAFVSEHALDISTDECRECVEDLKHWNERKRIRRMEGFQM
jgi:hypothetical protein